AFDIGEAHIQIVWQTVLERAVDEDFVQLGFEASLEAVAEFRQSNRFLGHFFLGDFASSAEPYDAGDIQCARAHTAFVAAAIDDGCQLYAGIAAANIKSANALGP